MNARRMLVVVLMGLTSYSAGALKMQNKKVIFEEVGDVAECSDKYNMDDCLRALDLWMKANPGHALEAAQAVRKNANAYNAVPYYKKAMDEKKGTCTDTDMLSVATAALALPKTSPQVSIAKDLAFKICLKDWKDDLAGEIDAGNTYYLDNACASLLAAKALNNERTKACSGH